jgi:peptidoglycan/LPS O-acetylase OafA/YrhL
VNNKYYWLDLVRGVSAVLVLLGHVRLLMLIPYAQVNNPTIPIRVIYFVSGFGPQAVIIFFVLSGFLITQSVDKSNFIMRDYFIARFSRLEVVLLPALIFGYLFDYIGFNFYSDTPFYGGTIAAIARIDFANTLTPEVFLGNAFFLHLLVYPILGSNGPLWSLSFEWWFYVMAPFWFVLIFGLQKKSILSNISLLILISSFVAYCNYTILIYFIIWLFGSVVYYLKKREVRFVRPKMHVAISFLGLFMAMTMSRLSLINYLLGDFVIAGFASYFVLTLLNFNQPKERRVISFFSNISYTLYAFHFPLVAILTSVFGLYNLSPTNEGMALYFFILCMTVFICFIFWFLFERNTHIVKKWIKIFIPK